MKSKILLLLIIQTLFSVETMFGQSTFQKTFGGAGSNDQAASVQQTTDGGYIISGAGYGDVYLIKTDANGDSTWLKTYGGPDEDFGSDVQQTADGGYIITGHTTDNTLNTSDVYLIKTDSSGNLLWTKAFGGTSDEHAYSVEQTSNGGYIIVGSTSSGFAASEDAYLIKTNANGNSVWKKTFGRSKMDVGFSIRQTTDGGYIFTGYSQKTTLPFDNDVYLVKTDVN